MPKDMFGQPITGDIAVLSVFVYFANSGSRRHDGAVFKTFSFLDSLCPAGGQKVPFVPELSEVGDERPKSPVADKLKEPLHHVLKERPRPLFRLTKLLRDNVLKRKI